MVDSIIGFQYVIQEHLSFGYALPGKEKDLNILLGIGTVIVN